MLLTKKITLLIIKKVDWVTGEEQQKVGRRIIQITMIIRKGKCRRWSARCLNIGTRGRLLRAKDIEQAFKETALGKSTLLSFTNHDYRDSKDESQMPIK